MSNTFFLLDRHQHSVGHGFFHTASVETLHETSDPFRYVYDCGAKKSRTLLAPAINSYVSTVMGEAIDLLIISHFHSDHANGLDTLLARKRVRTVIIPYVSPNERLMLVARLLSKMATGFDEIEMVARLDKWLRRRGVENVITIRHANDDNPPPEAHEIGGGPVPEAGWTLREGSQQGKVLQDETEVSDRSPVFLDRADAAVLEFLFFCWNPEASAHRFAEEWQAQGGKPAEELLTEEELPKLLRDSHRRRLVVHCYARTSKRGLNWTTLCVRAAPLEPTGVLSVSTGERELVRGRDIWRLRHGSAWLATGDLELGVPTVSRAFLSHYSNGLHVLSLSLPHHGSKHNFDPEVLGALRPSLVFATCPNQSAHHPSSGVVRMVRQTGALFAKVDESPSNELHERLLIAGRELPPQRVDASSSNPDRGGASS
jgi:beta-lactamase superfamily II metal-dependent hydrolase